MRSIDADALKKDIMSYKTMPEIRKAICEVIDNAPTVTPSLNFNNITEEDIEKFKTIFQRAHSKGLLTILEEDEIATKSQPKPLSDLINREALKRAISEATYNFEQIPIRVDKVQEIIDNAPAIDISGNEYFPYRTAYFNGVADGRATARPQDEHKPECKDCDYRKFTEQFIDGVVDVMIKNGISSVEELNRRLKGEES